MAEDLTEYYQEGGSKFGISIDIDTIERMAILRDLRLGQFDVPCRDNLLREGLDLPEVGLVGILDADREGFLRNQTSLIQTIGRAARNANGRVILYADRQTKSIVAALEETERRRKKQLEYNQKHGITPKTVSKPVSDLGDSSDDDTNSKQRNAAKVQAESVADLGELNALIEKTRSEMLAAADKLQFERAADLRDRLVARTDAPRSR